jgi:hypothetical protein
MLCRHLVVSPMLPFGPFAPLALPFLPALPNFHQFVVYLQHTNAEGPLLFSVSAPPYLHFVLLGEPQLSRPVVVIQ